MTVWTVYDSPLDYPGKFVLRGFLIGRDGSIFPLETAEVRDSLEDLRKLIPENTVRFNRTGLDDPKIVEVWL